MYFLVSPRNQSILQFETLELECSVTSLTIFNSTFSWNFTKRGSSTPEHIVKENESLSSEYSFRFISSNYASLKIEEVHWKHTGVYTCIVMGGSDMIQAKSSLNVLSELIIILLS